MTTIQGSISNLVENANIMFETMGYVSTDMANSQTHGYKAQRFETFLGPQKVLKGAVRVDASAGSHLPTFRDFDVAIEGAGYIPITTENGDVQYTRDGSFAINADGYIVAKNNCIVGSGIKIPTNYERVKIQPDGDVMIQVEKFGEFKKMGNIPVVVFQNPEGLEFKEGNVAEETKQSGKPELVLDHTKVKQGKLECSNVNQYALVNETVKLNGSIISSTRLIKMLDDMYREAINLRQ